MPLKRPSGCGATVSSSDLIRIGGGRGARRCAQMAPHGVEARDDRNRRVPRDNTSTSADTESLMVYDAPRPRSAQSFRCNVGATRARYGPGREAVGRHKTPLLRAGACYAHLSRTTPRGARAVVVRTDAAGDRFSVVVNFVVLTTLSCFLCSGGGSRSGESRKHHGQQSGNCGSRSSVSCESPFEKGYGHSELKIRSGADPY